jgi:hypothetical protein
MAQAQIYKITSSQTDKIYIGSKEQIDEYNREYSRDYRSAHKAQINEKFTCDGCGGKTTRSNISKHRKTKKHLKFVQSITNPC